MIHLSLALSILTVQRDLPVQFMPQSEFKFGVRDTILESKADEKPTLVLVNSADVTNIDLEAVSKDSKLRRIVQISRKEADGKLVSWNMSGRIITKNPLVVDKEFTDHMRVGELGIVLQSAYDTGEPLTEKTKPFVGTSIRAARSGTMILGPKKEFYMFQTIGVPKFPFMNVRLDIRVESVVGSIPAVAGTTKKINDVHYKVVGPMPDQGDKLEHLEVVSSGMPKTGSFILRAQYDWSKFEKETGTKVENRDLPPFLIPRKPGVPISMDDLHFDFPSNRPLKYLSSIAVVHMGSVQGFYQHVPTQPIEN